MTSFVSRYSGQQWVYAPTPEHRAMVREQMRADRRARLLRLAERRHCSAGQRAKLLRKAGRS